MVRTLTSRGGAACGVLLSLSAAGAEGPRAARSAPEPPAAAPLDSACFDHHELGQELRQAGKLVASRAAFRECAASQCPAAVQRDCERWSTEVATQLPGVTFRVTLDGQPSQGALVSIDDEPQQRALTEVVALDPGVHRVRISMPGARPFESEFELHASEPERHITVGLRSAGEQPSRGIPTLSWVFGGLGLAGAGAFVGFGLASRSLEQDLERRCAPFCSDEQIERVRQRSLYANISLGVGLASLATAGALYFLSSPVEPEPERAQLQMALEPLGMHGALWNVRWRAF
jgi:hypothetical protein